MTTEIMAANAVNKAAGKQSCADSISVEVLAAGGKVMMDDGLVFNIHRVIMLPEKVERWTGTKKPGIAPGLFRLSRVTLVPACPAAGSA